MIGVNSQISTGDTGERQRRHRLRDPDQHGHGRRRAADPAGQGRARLHRDHRKPVTPTLARSSGFREGTACWCRPSQPGSGGRQAGLQAPARRRSSSPARATRSAATCIVRGRRRPPVDSIDQLRDLLAARIRAIPISSSRGPRKSHSQRQARTAAIVTPADRPGWPRPLGLALPAEPFASTASGSDPEARPPARASGLSEGSGALPLSAAPSPFQEASAARVEAARELGVGKLVAAPGSAPRFASSVHSALAAEARLEAHVGDGAENGDPRHPPGRAGTGSAPVRTGPRSRRASRWRRPARARSESTTASRSRRSESSSRIEASVSSAQPLLERRVAQQRHAHQPRRSCRRRGPARRARRAPPPSSSSASSAFTGGTLREAVSRGGGAARAGRTPLRG